MKALHRPPAGSPPARLSVAVPFTRYPMSKHPPCVKPQTVHPGARLPSGGSLRARFAPLQRYYARTKTAARASPPLRFLRRRLIPCASVGLCLRSARTPRGGDARPQGLALGPRLGPSGYTYGNAYGSPRLPGNPLVLLPCSRTPPGGRAHARTDAPGRPRRIESEDSPEAGVFRGSITRLRHPPPTLPASVTLYGQGWLPAAWHALPGGVRRNACTRWVPTTNFSHRFLACHLPSCRP
jgi:hypothetical protein